MKICFSVDSPKIDKRIINRGEDAPAVNKDGILIICDGTGATGQAEHTIAGEVYTSAYLGSRITSQIASSFLSRNCEQLLSAFSDMEQLQKTVSELGRAIRTGLNRYVHKNHLTLTLHGKSFKLLPTTFTAVVYKAYETKLQVIVLSAGDSRALWWDTDGLHQLTPEDSDNQTLTAGDCSVSNCVSADADFHISYRCYELPPRGILLAASDGFTDPVKPFEQERYLIEWIGNFDNLCEDNSPQLSAEISRKMDDIGFTRRDDCSIAGVILGYSSEKELKTDFRNRYKQELIETYLKPYRELNTRYKEAEEQLARAEAALSEQGQPIVEAIQTGILRYLGSDPCCSLSIDDPLFQTLIHTDAVSMEIAKEHDRIERRLKEKKCLYAETEARLKADYLEFLMLLCRDFGRVRFSDELIRAVQHYETNDETVTRYFSYQNDEIIRYFQEDIRNRFYILKKASKIPLFHSKKYKRLRAHSRVLLRLHEAAEELRKQTSDRYVQKQITEAYRKTLLRFCREIADDLFYRDKYRDYLPEDLGETNIPQLICYKQRKNDLQSIITQRNKLEEHYGRTYEYYLINAASQGKIVFGTEGCNEYGNNQRL